MKASNVIQKAKELWIDAGRPSQFEWFLPKAYGGLDDRTLRAANVFWARAKQVTEERIDQAIELAEKEERGGK